MLTIGQLARIFDISTKTLRHYDAIGLFVPARTGSDNGYRYYQPEQIEQLSRILALRRLDVPLEAIDRLKRDGALDDPQRLRHFLQRHQHTLREEISARQRLLAELDRTLATLAHWRIRNMHARIVERPAFSVVGMEYFGSAPGDTIGQLWERFIPREHEIAGKHVPEVSYGICAQQPNGEFHYVAGFEVQEGWPVPEGMVRFQVPAQKYAVFTHKGTAPQIAESFQAIYSHLLAERGLEPKAGVDFEYYDQRFRGPLDPNSQVDLYIPIY
ncbi:c-di-GMP-binding multidrug transporter transcriptional regulator BrlR [Pseudomonas aeruginosa]|uniref:c-di-GMP-binding multidrug transporter transcriptional regulator BrlR n=1 Tax=Pseudomonas aeruginosa TaxID=287 RepID=UPI000DEFEFA2|nr:c-di-GMP-binding multidrug transporter transcriptional regulator BrlR [Pseudomonas aeruginosa]MCT5886927.1 c-di-GMP-binding multidrug transporter transcriptional regulator BrlR [Pseudomonas aeruginosa]RCN14477.1 Multidrug-efflux transporter 1 regulator [Pseudomonas aeruginosa]